MNSFFKINNSNGQNPHIQAAAILTAAVLAASMLPGCELRKSEQKLDKFVDTIDFVVENDTLSTAPDSRVESEQAQPKNAAPIMYVTGAQSVPVYNEPDGEQVDTISCGTAVEAEKNSDLGAYVKIKDKSGAISGYVSGKYLVDDAQSVTNGLRICAASEGAEVNDKSDGSGETIETLYGGEEITLLAKTSGGFWRVQTDYGNCGYVNVMQLDSSSIRSDESQSGIDHTDGSSTAVSSATAQTESERSESAPISTDSESRANSGDIDTVLNSAVYEAQGSVGGNWAAAYIDLSTGESSSVNSSSMQAASLIKLYIMGAIYENYNTYLSADPDIDSYLYSMITVSDNSSANHLVSILGSGNSDAGKSVVTAYAQSHGYASTSMGRLLLESNINGDNYTSVTDCAGFLAAAYNGELPHSAEMMSLLSQQTVTTKIPAGVPVRTANKTGELDSVQNDAAIVYAEKPYVLCVMSENVSAGAAISAIVNMSSEIYSNQ